MTMGPGSVSMSGCEPKSDNGQDGTNIRWQTLWTAKASRRSLERGKCGNSSYFAKDLAIFLPRFYKIGRKIMDGDNVAKYPSAKLRQFGFQ